MALGSHSALAPAVVLIPVLICRLLNEGRVLRQELTGYAEYLFAHPLSARSQRLVDRRVLFRSGEWANSIWYRQIG